MSIYDWPLRALTLYPGATKPIFWKYLKIRLNKVWLWPSLGDLKFQFCQSAAKKCCGSGNYLICIPTLGRQILKYFFGSSMVVMVLGSVHILCIQLLPISGRLPLRNQNDHYPKPPNLRKMIMLYLHWDLDIWGR